MNIDEVLRTTRAVRKRLDLERDVPTELLVECIELASQAPTKRNHQHWRFVVVRDAGLRAQVAKQYKEAWYQIDRSKHDAYGPNDPRSRTLPRVLESAKYLADHLHEVPVLVVPCIGGRTPVDAAPGHLIAELASVLPAMWSFMLAARARGLGTVLTTTHLAREEEVARILEIPYHAVTQVGLVPVAYALGENFSAASRLPISSLVCWDAWSEPDGPTRR